MAGNDRSELIKALSNAYKTGDTVVSGFVTETTRMDGHNYTHAYRVDGEDPERMPYIAYPDAVVIRDFSTLLKQTRDASAEKAGRELENKFIKAAEAKNSQLIEQMIDLSRKYSTRLRGMPESNPQRVLMLMLAEGEIAKL